MVSETSVDGLTRFERVVVFRVARGYFVAMAVVAVILFLGGLVLCVRSLVNIRPAEQAVPPPPPPPAPTTAQVMSELDADNRAQVDPGRELGSRGSSQATAQQQAAMRSALDIQIERLKAVLPDPPYPWANQIESFCADPTAFGCLRRDTRIKKKGISGAIAAAVGDLDTDETVETLKLLVGILENAAIEKRGELITPAVRLIKRQRMRHAQELKDYEDRVEEQRAKNEKLTAEADADRGRWMMWGLYGIGSGFALLISVSLFLAFLSIERHTRALQGLAVSGGLREVPDARQTI